MNSTFGFWASPPILATWGNYAWSKPAFTRT